MWINILMRYNEINNIEEYQHADGEGNWGFPEFSDSDHIGHLQSSEGTLSIYEKRIGDDIYFGVGIDHTQLYSFLVLSDFKGDIKRASYAKSEKPGLKIMSNLFSWLLDNSSYKIISDYTLTDSGEGLWHSFKYKKPNSFKIFNIKTGEKFKYSDIGKKKTKSGGKIIDPMFDTTEPRDQKWFYLLECTNSGIYRGRKMGNVGPIAPPRIF